MKRYKISRIRPEITIEEAGKMADFDLLVKAQKGSGASMSRYWRLVRGAIVTVAVATLVYFAINNDSYELGEYMPDITSNEIPDAPKMPQSPASAPIVEIPEQERIVEQEEDRIEEIEHLVNAETSEEEESIEEDIDISQSGYVEAVPIDGFPALYRYFDENLVYPHEILDEGVQGSVIVRFEIDTAGIPANIMVEKSLHQKLDSTAIALIGEMPLWQPAMLYGRPIQSTHRIPLFFKIDETAE